MQKDSDSDGMEWGNPSLFGRTPGEVELLQATLGNVTSGVTIADARSPELPLIYVNPGFEVLTGYSAAEAIGQSCRFLQGEERDQPGLDVLRAALRNAEPCVVRLRNFHKDGTLFYNELRISPVRNKDGELTHFVGIQLDVTDRVRARESLENSERQTRLALQREAELNEIKSRFISMVSHEFRTPMTGIQSSASLIRKFGEKLGQEKVDRHWENIHGSLKRMNRLLDDVLFFSRSEADKVEVLREPVDLASYLGALMEGLRPAYPGRTVQLGNTLPESTICLLDVHLLDHILHNLLGNALKYSSADKTVLLSVMQEEDSLCFKVSDRGIGIPKADREHLFEAFHRAGNVGARIGTGLGLNIARRAAELLGGELTFSSTEGEGSIFVAKLPILEKEL